MMTPEAATPARPARPARPSTFHSFTTTLQRIRQQERGPMSHHASGLTLDQATEVTRTGDLWLFRGSSAADQAIRVVTNAPVNHVGMAVVIDELPPLMWHAELGKGLR